MRCSICERSDTRYIYNDWHCSVCEDSIRQAVGELYEEDIAEIFSIDNRFDFNLSVDTTDYNSCVGENKTDE